jgi:hypothetical protein
VKLIRMAVYVSGLLLISLGAKANSRTASTNELTIKEGIEQLATPQLRACVLDWGPLKTSTCIQKSVRCVNWVAPAIT